jgi:glycerol-3-phosphate acyltransferase PlsY
MGSGNTGATNVARTLGKGPGALVLALDVAKGAVPALAAPWLAQRGWLPDGFPHALWLGLAAVLGHTFSPWLRFRGGKGVATGLGAVLASCPVPGAAGLATFALVMLSVRIVSLGSLLGAFVIWATTLALYPDWRIVAPVTFIVAYVFWRHRENIHRLRRGEEPRFQFGSARRETEVAGP